MVAFSKTIFISTKIVKGCEEIKELRSYILRLFSDNFTSQIFVHVEIGLCLLYMDYG